MAIPVALFMLRAVNGFEGTPEAIGLLTLVAFA